MRDLFVIALVLLFGVSVAEAKPKKAETKSEKVETKKEEKKEMSARPDGLVIEDVKEGSGTAAKLGSKITVHYKGTLKKDGKVFDSSYDRKEPITFDLLEGRLIKGWTEGIPGMKVGGKRKLTIPYAMAYGDSGTPDGAIPPKSDLNFEVELIEVK
jgi:FKBP-type peptidyl-prolyl cis-trans isomerase